MQGKQGLGLKQIDELADAEVLVEQQAFGRRHGSAIVLVEKFANCRLGVVVELHSQDGASQFGLQRWLLGRHDLRQNLDFGGCPCGTGNLQRLQVIRQFILAQAATLWQRIGRGYSGAYEQARFPAP